MKPEVRSGERFLRRSSAALRSLAKKRKPVYLIGIGRDTDVYAFAAEAKLRFEYGIHVDRGILCRKGCVLEGYNPDLALGSIVLGLDLYSDEERKYLFLETVEDHLVKPVCIVYGWVLPEGKNNYEIFNPDSLSKKLLRMEEDLDPEMLAQDHQDTVYIEEARRILRRAELGFGFDAESFDQIARKMYEINTRPDAEEWLIRAWETQWRRRERNEGKKLF